MTLEEFEFVVTLRVWFGNLIGLTAEGEDPTDLFRAAYCLDWPFSAEAFLCDLQAASNHGDTVTLTKVHPIRKS